MVEMGGLGWLQPPPPPSGEGRVSPGFGATQIFRINFTPSGPARRENSGPPPWLEAARGMLPANLPVLSSALSGAGVPGGLRF